MVRTLLPAMGGIALRPQVCSQRSGRNVTRGKTGQHEHRMPIAARRAPQQRLQQQEGLQFPDRTHFERQQQPRRRS